MQKIIFISIILLTGLFSLQMQLAAKTQPYFQASLNEHDLILTPVKQAEASQLRIYYIYTGNDTLGICTKESLELIQL